MTDFIFKTPSMLALLLILPAFIILFVLRRRWRRRDCQAFSKKMAHERQKNSSETIRFSLLLVAVICIIIALTRPAWDPQPQMLQRRGRDTVFVLDVSNSMLAQDVAPSRLERAKIAIAECIQTFEGHRVALVLFAGSSSIQCPLTTDYDFFLQRLENASPDTVAQGGTRLDEALLKTGDKIFNSSTSGFRDIILITDGGNQGNNEKAAIEQINEKKLRLICLGFGDEIQGARIPATNEESDFMTYKGREVWTKLESEALRQLTKSCHEGIYLAVGTKSLNLSEVYKGLNKHQPAHVTGEESHMVYDEKFALFIAAALTLLALKALLPLSTGAKKVPRSALILIMALPLSSHLKAADNTELLQRAIKLQEQFDGNPSPLIAYNIGVNYYRLGKIEEATEAFSLSLQHGGHAPLRRKATFNLANCLFNNARHTENPSVALLNLSQARKLYRKILTDDAQDQKAAHNLEMTLNFMAEVEKVLKEQEEKQKQIQKKLDNLRKLLKKLIKDQKANLEDTQRLLSATDDTLMKKIFESQENIIQVTESTQKLMQNLSDTSFSQLPPDENPMTKSIHAIKEAKTNEEAALRNMTADTTRAVNEEDNAAQNLQKALDNLPASPDQKGQKKKSDKKSDSDEESDSEESEENDENGQEAPDSQEASGDFKSNLNNQELPPPTESPADILKQEMQNRQQRQAQGSGKKSKVEKDW